jgi:hypothetical protein
MKSLWKDLLFLHGHVPHKNLPWRTDTAAQPDGDKSLRVIGKPTVVVPMRCALAWPRIMRPR